MDAAWSGESKFIKTLKAFERIQKNRLIEVNQAEVSGMEWTRERIYMQTDNCGDLGKPFTGPNFDFFCFTYF